MATFAWSAFYTDSACNAYERLDYTPSQCMPTTPDPACTVFPADNGWFQQTGCTNDIASLGNSHLGQAAGRFQFWRYAKPDCSGDVLSVTELTVGVSDCKANVEGYTDMNGAIYAKERVTVALDGSVARSFFSDGVCKDLMSRVLFAGSGSCSGGMKLVEVTRWGLMEQVYYGGPGCTGDVELLRYSRDVEACDANAVGDCDSSNPGINSRVLCPPTSLDWKAESVSKFGQGKFVSLQWYIDGGCTIPDYSESLRVGKCQATVLQPDSRQGYSYRVDVSGTTVTYTTFADFECQKVSDSGAVTVSMDGKCSNGVVVVGGNAGPAPAPAPTSAAGGSNPVTPPPSTTAGLGGSMGGSNGGSSGSNGIGAGSTGGNSNTGNGSGSNSGSSGSSNGGSSSGSNTGSTSGGSTDSSSSSSSQNNNGPNSQGNFTPSQNAPVNIGLIGGIIGSVCAVILLVAGAVVLMRRKKEKVEASRDFEALPHIPPTATAVTVQDDTKTIATMAETVDVVSGTDESIVRVMTVHQVTETQPVYLEKGEEANALFRGIPVGGVIRGGEKAEEPVVVVDDGAVLPENPADWSITQVAVWVARCGVPNAHVVEQRIDGVALLALEEADLYTALGVNTVGDRVRLKRGLETLYTAPPTYNA